MIVLYYFIYFILFYFHILKYFFIILYVLVHITLNLIVGLTKQSYQKYQKRLRMSLINLAGFILRKSGEEL